MSVTKIHKRRRRRYSDREFSSECVNQIAEKVRAVTGEKPDLWIVERNLDWLFGKWYRRYALFSRDNMPTMTEIARAARQLSDHLQQAQQLICCELPPQLLQYVQYEGRKVHSDEFDFFGAMDDCFKAAESLAEKYEQNVEEGLPIQFHGRDGRLIEHHKRTATDVRDNYLIPCIVGYLAAFGEFEFYDASGNIDYDTLDAACEIIEIILRSQNIPVPHFGDLALIASYGEVRQGRGRRRVKEVLKEFKADGMFEDIAKKRRRDAGESVN